MILKRFTLNITGAIILALAVVLSKNASLQAQELVRIPGFDGIIIEGRLHIPSDRVRTLVIDVPGSGPHTYLNRRRIGRSIEFNYHDYFADELYSRDIAYFSYSTRHTVPDSTPPLFDRVDRDLFCSVTPQIKVRDLESVIHFLKKDERLQSAKIILLGFSEGAIIAGLAAERKNAAVDALFLAGTPSEDVYSLILWQHSGASSMINYRKFFDSNGDGIIERSEYDGGDPRARARVGGYAFEQLDMNRDSVLSTDDFRILMKPRLEAILSAIERNDDEWIWTSFFRVGTQWIREHRALEPNKTRILRLDIPVFLFHGENDANTPVEGILEMQKTAQRQNRENIHFFIFPDHDHSLEFLSWVVRKTMPEGLKVLFQELENF
ncbi:MAG TPA: alpha/beta hydrolase [bacterium]|nr:alpha/beta hydrolase [bacterium]